MIDPTQQQRDELLTAAGHDPECPVYRDERCDCQPDNLPDRAARTLTKYPPAAAPGSVTLTGGVAEAFHRYQAAARRLRDAEAVHQAATTEYQQAHQAFASAAVEV